MKLKQKSDSVDERIACTRNKVYKWCFNLLCVGIFVDIVIKFNEWWFEHTHYGIQGFPSFGLFLGIEICVLAVAFIANVFLLAYNGINYGIEIEQEKFPINYYASLSYYFAMSISFCAFIISLIEQIVWLLKLGIPNVGRSILGSMLISSALGLALGLFLFGFFLIVFFIAFKFAQKRRAREERESDRLTEEELDAFNQFKKTEQESGINKNLYQAKCKASASFSMSFSTRLKELRLEQGLTQKNFALALSVSPSTVFDWEKRNKQPCYETLCAIADYFSVSIDYLLGRTQ